MRFFSFSLLVCIFVMVCCLGKGVESDISSINNGDGLTEEKMKNIKGVYCGKKLSGTISMICNYNSRLKRNIGAKRDYFGNGLENERFFDSKSMLPPLLAKELAHLMFPKKYEKRLPNPQFQSRVRAADECCKKSCTLWELSSYCD